MAGIYVHIPYCHSKCAYCDFYSMPNLRTLPRFPAAVTREWELRRGECPGPFGTIYLGGGTPSLLPPQALAAIFAALPVADAKEVTIEVNPEDVTPEAVAAWRALGVNRCSMGVQSLCDSELALIGRRHSAADAVRAFRTLRDGGIENISIDLIYGLPAQTLNSWIATLDKAMELRPAHLSAYILSYEPRTRLEAMRRSGKVHPASDELILEMYDHLCREMRRQGYEHYEISNFALPGLHSAHNSSYWDGTPYIGLGPGAHSFDGAIRRINPGDLSSYLAKLEQGMVACKLDEETDDNRFNDMLITALRTAVGLDLAQVPTQRLAQLRRDAAPHLKAGALCEEGGHWIIPERHWPLADSILADLVQI